MASIKKTTVRHKHDTHLGKGVVCFRGTKKYYPGRWMVSWKGRRLTAWHFIDVLEVVKEEAINA